LETTHYTPEQLTERFDFAQKYRNIVYGLIGAGLLLFIIGAFFADSGEHAASDGHATVTEQTHVHTVADTDDGGEAGGHGLRHITGFTRIAANFLLGNLYFFTLVLGAMFFLTVHRVGNAGWHTAIRRVPEAITTYLPVAALGCVAVMFLLPVLYDWASPAAAHDALIQTKSAYLNQTSFIIRNVLFFVLWAGAAWWLRQLSLKQDLEGGLSHFNKSVKISVVYIIVFALSFTLWSVDWIQSLEPHWFSTIYGIYIFAGSMVSAMVTMILITLFLKRQGYMSYVNDAHIHDLAKYAFGFTVFWGYIFVAQYLLIWYSNIPEEGFWYVHRYRVHDEAYKGYAFFFYFNIIVNFLIPFLVLMTRNAKRNPKVLVPIGILMLFGHWVDLFQLIMPGAIYNFQGVGLLELGAMLLFAGIFLSVVLSSLSKANLVPVNHPYLEESLHHSTGPV
jgi:hypothetical protein